MGEHALGQRVGLAGSERALVGALDGVGVRAVSDRDAGSLEDRGHRGVGRRRVGVLLENVPEFSFWLGAAALAGGVVVGINPTRRGAELARDIRHTDCQWIVTEPCHAPLLAGLDLGVPAERVFDVESARYAEAL